MTLFDFVALGVVAISVVLGLVRGAVREVLSLLSWVGAFLLARAYTEPLSVHLASSIQSPTLRLLATFVVLFLLALALFTLLAWALAQLLKSLGLGPLDKMFGMLFGVARAALILVALVLLAGLTPLPREAFWRNAMFSAPLEAAAKEVLPYMPEAFRKRIGY